MEYLSNQRNFGGFRSGSKIEPSTGSAFSRPSSSRYPDSSKRSGTFQRSDCDDVHGALSMNERRHRSYNGKDQATLPYKNQKFAPLSKAIFSFERERVVYHGTAEASFDDSSRISADKYLFLRASDEETANGGENPEDARRSRGSLREQSVHQGLNGNILARNGIDDEVEELQKLSLRSGMATERYRGLVLRVTSWGAYIWPMDPKAKAELVLENKYFSEKDTLQTADWIEYRSIDGKIREFKKIESEAMTMIKSNSVWVRTEVINVMKYSANSGRWHYIGESLLVGKVGFYNVAGDIEGNRSLDVWVKRNSELNSRNEIPNVFWRYVKQSSGSLGDEQKRIGDDSGYLLMGSANDYSSCAQAPVSSSALQANFSPSMNPNPIPIGETSCGVVVHKKNHLGYVWSSDYGEGLIADCLGFSAGDWISFVTAPIKTLGSSKYIARELKLIDSLYPVAVTQFKIIVHVPARALRHGTTFAVYAEWFGEVDFIDYAIRNANLSPKEQFIARIENRKKNSQSYWMATGIESSLKNNAIRKPLLGCKDYELKMLQYLFEDERVRKAAREYNPDLAASVGKLVGMPLDF